MQPFSSERLTYRPYRRSDAAAAFAIFSDPDVMKYGVASVHVSVEQTVASLADQIEMNRRYGYSVWAVIERATGDFIGMAGLAKFEPDNEPELAYWLRRDRWGRGYGTEAARAWIEKGFADLDLPQIVAFVEPEHKVSRHILEKVGLHFVDRRTYRGKLVDYLVIDRPEQD